MSTLFPDLSSNEGTLGDADQDVNEVVDPSKNGQIVQIGTAQKPLIFKIVPQRRPNGVVESYWKVAHHSHLIGDMDIEKDVRQHLCQKILGRKECKECDRFFETKNVFWDLENEAKKNPGVKASREYKLAQIQQKLLDPRQSGWAHIVLPNNPQVKALRLGKDVINKLFGKEKTKYRPAVESLIKKMREGGDDPYNLRSKTGWIVAYAVGEKLAKEYTVKMAVETIQVNVPQSDGSTRSRPAEVPASFDVHPNIFQTKREDLPNLMKLEERKVWTVEESAAFAKDLKTPDRVLKEAGSEESADDMTAGHGNATPDVPPASALPPSVEATAKLAAQVTPPSVNPNAINDVL